MYSSSCIAKNGSSPCSLLEDSTKDRKSTRLNSSHSQISYAVFCLKKKKKHHTSILRLPPRRRTHACIDTRSDSRVLSCTYTRQRSYCDRPTLSLVAHHPR